MTIPTEPIGSIPRPLKLVAAVARYGSAYPGLGLLYDEAVRDTIDQFEATGSPVVTDGEQRKYQNDCGFSPFCDDTSTSREKAFAKIRSRVEGTALAEGILNGR